MATLSLSLLLIFQRHIPISCAQFGSRWVCIRTAPHTHTHLFLARHFHSNQRHTHSVPCSEWRTFHPSARLSLSFLLAPVSDWWLLLFNDVRPIASDCWTRNVPVSWKSNYRRERERLLHVIEFMMALLSSDSRTTDATRRVDHHNPLNNDIKLVFRHHPGRWRARTLSSYF